MLTQSELQMIAQRHLNTVLMHIEYLEWTGEECDRLSSLRESLHESRFWQLFEQLSPEGQKRFMGQIEIRKQYIESVAAEVRRCGEEEAAFWNAVEEGILSEDDIAAHVTPPCISGCGSMPSPADGGPGPEQWDMFDSYDGNPFADSNEVANGGA
jgi:hypothetical protein